MRKNLWLFPIVGALLLSGCGNDPKDPNAENFKAALVKHYASVGCMDWNPAKIRHHKLTDKAWPIRIDAYQIAFAEDLDAMVSAGILKSEDKEIMTTQQVLNKTYERKVKVRDYDLTDLGRTSLKNPDGESFCQYDIEVEKVIRWDEPFQRLGETVTRVKFIGKPKNIQAWIDNEDVKKAMSLNLSKRLKVKNRHEAGEMTIMLRLTEEGWVVKKH